jgi:hypothetical protein
MQTSTEGNEALNSHHVLPARAAISRHTICRLAASAMHALQANSLSANRNWPEMRQRAARDIGR